MTIEITPELQAWRVSAHRWDHKCLPPRGAWVPYSDGECPEHFAHIEQGSAELPCNTWIEVPYTAVCDYGGCGAVGEANTRAMEEILEAIDPDGERYGTVIGEFSSRMLVIRQDIDEIDPDGQVLDALASLADYPLLNDELHSEVMEEWKQATWDCWARSDYQHELRKRFPGLDDAIDELNDESLDSLWYEHAETSGDELWIDESAYETLHCYTERGAAMTPRESVELAILAPLFDWLRPEGGKHANAS